MGVARSGLMPASLLAMHLHLPLLMLDQDGDVRPPGHGWRLGKMPHKPSGAALSVDDTVGSGRSLQKATPIARQHFRSLLYATVYLNPLSPHKPDLWAADLHQPHILRWNFPNSVVALPTAFDLDGVIGHDEHSGGPPGTPYLLPRREPVHIIITGRRETLRAGTLDWLARWRGGACRRPGCQCCRTTTRGRSPTTRPRRSSGSPAPPTRGPPMYVESCPKQARRIAELSGVLTVCPITREVLGPDGCWLYGDRILTEPKIAISHAVLGNADRSEVGQSASAGLECA